MQVRPLLGKVAYFVARDPVSKHAISLLHRWVNRKRKSMLAHPIDVEYHIETSGYRSGDLLYNRREAAHYRGYMGCQPSTVLRAVREVENPAEYSFIDIGCGKGRALAVASKAGFRRVIGVELSPELCRIAEANSKTLAGRYADHPVIEIVESNAVTYPLPSGNVLIFLFCPFDAETVALFSKSVEAAQKAEKRNIIIAYAYPVHSNVFDGMNGFRRVLDEWVPVTESESAFAEYQRYKVMTWQNMDVAVS